MGVSSTTNRAIYSGDGVSLTFPFAYYFFKTTDLVVYLYDTVLGLPTLQTLGADYTISGTPNAQGLYINGGNVVFGVAPASTKIVVIFRNPPEQQNYALLQNGQISSTAIVQQFDYLTLLIQRLEDQVSRCVQIPDGVGSTFDPHLPGNTPLFPNAFLQINANGNGMLIANQASNFMKVTKSYTDLQTGSTTNTLKLFTLPPTYMLTGLVMKHSTAFVGASITALQASIGIAGDTSRFLTGFDFLQAVADTAWDSVYASFIGSWASNTDVNLTVAATGANLSALSAGSVDVFYSYIVV